MHILLVIIILLAACSQVSEVSQPSPMVTMTDTAVVTPTLMLPPTVTEGGFPTYTWSPTSTSAIEVSPTPTSKPSVTTTEFYPTYPPLPFIAARKYSSIRFVNNSGKTVRFTLYGADVIDLTIGKTLIVKVRFDTYYFTAFIGKNGPYNGSIFINNMDRYTVFIDEENIRVAYP